MAENRNGDLPSWVHVARAVASTVVGLMVILGEALGDGPGRVVLLAAALLLIGFAPADLVTFFRGRGGGPA